MLTNKNMPYYLTAVGLFILLKFGFTVADNNDLSFLLKPTNQLVGLLTDSQSMYLADNGYYHARLNILIDKSCSGFNFWTLSFVIFTYLTVRYFDTNLHKILTIPFALIAAYLLTIFANTSRIVASIMVQAHTKNILPNHQHILHETIGIVTNLTLLILAYFLIEQRLIHKRHYAKLT